MKKSTTTSGKGAPRHHQSSLRPRPDHGSKDEFNADTFGEAAFSDLHDEFHFGGALPPPTGRGREGSAMRPTPSLSDLDPAIALVTTGGGTGGRPLAGEDEEGPPGMAPGMSPDINAEHGMRSSPVSIGRMGGTLPVHAAATGMSFGSPSPRRVLTLNEIEARLSQASLRSDGEELISTTITSSQGRWLAPRNATKSTAISFPHYADDETAESGDEGERLAALARTRVDSPWERHRWVLTRFEREGVARIHLSQLSTEHADVEDYYYRAYARRTTSKRGGGSSLGAAITPPLYLPLPTPRRRERGERDKVDRVEATKPSGQVALMKEALASALGKKSASSSKRPRQQLVVPALASESGTSDGIYSATAAVELLYQAIFCVEDALAAAEDKDRDGKDLHESRREAIELIDHQLGLRLSLEELSRGQVGGGRTTGLTRFLNILALPKAKKILGRALKAIDDARLSERLLTRLVELFEYLDVCRVDASETDINLFVNCLLAGLVPHVAKVAGWEEVEAKLQLMLAKTSLSWIAGTKAGLVLLCILLSRGEILKGTAAGEGVGAHWASLVERLFDQLGDRLPELFNSLQGADGEFYGWQFMALLALNVDADRKRQMVMELRERILATANAPAQVAVDNLNIFLNALGLDASHLRGEQ